MCDFFKETNNIHLRLRFGLGTANNTYLMLKISFFVGEILKLKYILIEFVIPNLSLRF